MGKKGRNQAITAADVLEILEEEGQITVNDLADRFLVNPQTVRKRLRELRQDGESIIHDRKGVMLIDKVTVETDEDVADAFAAFIDWILKTFKGLMFCGKPTQPLLPALKRNMKERLTKAERAQLRLASVRLRAIIDTIEYDEEM
jgi:DNA-binding MarR family transcriptional regulator